MQDCVFLDAGEAADQAHLRQRVDLGAAITGLQICYFLGETPPSDPPENLVHVPLADAANWWARTRYRLPTQLQLPRSITDPDEIARLGQMVHRLLSPAVAIRNQAATEIRHRYASRPIQPKPDRDRLRVMAWSSRLTTVMQYCSRALLSAFSSLGHETRLETEANEMEALDDSHLYAALAEFDPHLIININHANHRYLPTDLVNVVWWQDPLADDTIGKWRERDLIYSVVSQFVAPVLATGLAPERVALQPFCIDRDCFRVEASAAEREDKVVFVGTAAGTQFAKNARALAVIAEISQRLEAGESIFNHEVAALGAKHGIPEVEAVCEIFYGVTRDYAVRWLCQTPGIKIEIYGPGWERDEIVAPFHRGALAHGRAVADVYRSAKYALVVHPFSVSTQRLAEAAACGCIPIIYDCRFQADFPHWEEWALYFRTRADLTACVRADRPTVATKIAEYFDYTRFAQRILHDAAKFF